MHTRLKEFIRFDNFDIKSHFPVLTINCFESEFRFNKPNEFQHLYQTKTVELGEDLLQGANYQILLQYIEGQENPNLSKLIVHKITSENELHIFLLLPQFVIMTAGEIMFSITSLQFSFTQVF